MPLEFWLRSVPPPTALDHCTISFGQTNQQRQAKQPQGFIDPAFGREMKKNLDDYKRTGVNASFEEHRNQPLEVDAQTWAKDFNEAVRFSKLAFLLTPEDGPDTSK